MAWLATRALRTGLRAGRHWALAPPPPPVPPHPGCPWAAGRRLLTASADHGHDSLPGATLLQEWRTRQDLIYANESELLDRMLKQPRVDPGDVFACSVGAQLPRGLQPPPDPRAPTPRRRMCIWRM